MKKQRWVVRAQGWMGRPGRIRPVRTATIVRRAAALVGLWAGGLALAVPVEAQLRSGASAWAIEAAGGTLGSLAGFGLGMSVVDDDCQDDLDCIFSNVAAVLALATGGAALGAWAIGSGLDTDPSLGGAVVGSVVGAAAGLGVLKLLDEMGSGTPDDGTVWFAFSLTQGVVTGLGSRLGAAVW